MAASFDDLTQPMTRDEVKESIYTVLAQVGINTTNWKPGAVVRTIIAIFSVVIAALSVWTAQIARGGFLSLATGSWLKLCAFYVFGVRAIEATFATGPLKITNNGGGVYSFEAGEFIVNNPTTGKAYRNVSAFSLGAMQEITTTIIAAEAGSASTAEIHQITAITAPAVSSVAVTNDTRLVGRDDETDPELVTRSQESLGALSPNGPWDAYAYAVKTATRDDGSTLGITRTRIIKDGFGNVRVIVATPDSGVEPDDVTIAEAAVVLNAEPQCVNATVESANPVVIAPTYEAWIYNTAGLTDAQAKQAIYNGLVAFMKTQPIAGNVIPPATGGYVYASAIQSAIQSAIPQCIRATVAGSDIALDVTDVPILGAPTATVHFVAPPEGQTV